MNRRAEPVLSMNFKTPKSNDFQWRNLYVKQFGIPTYPPPLPKNISTTNEEYPKRSDLQNYLGELHDDGEQQVFNTLDGAGMPRNTAEEVNSTPNPQPSSMNRSVTDSHLGFLDDSELFTPNLFDFLIPKRRGGGGGGGGSGGGGPPSHTNSNDDSIHTPNDSNPRGDSFATLDQDHELQEKTNPHGLPLEILSLQHNAWTLLMDNRPLAWLERTVSQKGQSAISMRSKLLEIAVGPNPVSASWKELGEEALEQFVPPPISEDAAANRVFESFSPYFAVISHPPLLARLRDHYLASRRAQLRGHPGAAADLVGFPLFSQFASWKEAYENRKAWNCAPFSFFLIYDTSYNYAHISALYMMVSLIHQHAHVHTSKCLEGKGDPIALEEASHHLAQSKTVRKLVEGRRYLCPLVATQKLSEDIILAFEQSASRTTLTMMLQVCGFITDCVLEPEVCARFLSREALFRQAEFTVPGMNQRKDSTAERRESMNETSTLNNSEAASAAQKLNSNLADVFSLKRFSEKEFEAMFDLTYWFIDAATANCRIPIDPALLPPTAAEKERKEREEREKRERKEAEEREKDSGVANSEESPSSSTIFGRRGFGGLGGGGARSVTPSATNVSAGREKELPFGKHLVSEHLYTPGKIQVFAPVGSIVEVLILYNMRRHALHKMMLNNLAAQQQSKGKRRNSVLPPDVPTLAAEEYDRKSTNLSPSTTLLSTPLILISTYIRLHGAPWLKHIFSRIFNILRRESVVLYVNRIDLEDPFGAPEESIMENSMESGQLDSMLRGSGQGNHGFLGHMERLEDLISQDILYVLNEFFSALHGKRSATRLPQGVTTLITQFCTTIHLHILSAMVQPGETRRNTLGATAVARVNEFLYTLKQKQMAAKAFRAELISDYAMTRLVSTIEQFRLAKFILFDCWIIPALNNVTAFGYLSETSSTHLKWNIDAFARYLKILVNGPFTETDKGRDKERAMPLNLNSSSSVNNRSASLQRSKTQVPPKKVPKEVTKPPFTLTIPRYITGIYDVSSGSLVRLFSEAEPMSHTFLEPSASGTVGSERHVPETSLPSLENTFGKSRTMGTSIATTGTRGLTRDFLYQQSLQQSFAKNLYYRAMDDATWDDMSSLMRGLNESLGLLGYDPEEEADMYTTVGIAGGMFSEESCAMRMLDAFCRRASAESTGSVVTAEFEVLPSMAASCIDKIYEMMTGTHPLVEQAISSGVFPGKFSYSPYLACLNGCLLHPKLALQALDNVMQNSRRFYNTLMQPVTNQVMLDLVGSLIQNPEELPVVDTNALTPLLTTLPAAQSDTSSGGGALSSKVEAEVRKLRLHHSFLTTGCSRTTLGMKLLLNRAGPFNPYVVLEEGRRRIEREIGMAPSTFDPWWRAMALALCVKVTNVFSECSPTLSEYFENWCSQQLDGNRKESRVVTNMFINTKGGALVAPSAPAEKKTARKKGMPDENSAFAPPTSKAPKKKKKKKKVKKPKSASLRKVGSASVSTNPLGTSQRSPSPSSTPFTG